MAHNKTLAAQLYQEFTPLLPEQRRRVLRQLLRLLPARGLRPATDTYIEKEATINDEIDRMRLSATRSLFERRDVIIVASVSCIYGLGSPEAYYGMMLPLERGQRIDRDADPAQAGRDPVRAQRPRLRPRHVPRARRHRRGRTRRTKRAALRIELFGDEVDELDLVRSADRQDDPAARQGRRSIPKSHFVTPRETDASARSRPSRRS